MQSRKEYIRENIAFRVLKERPKRKKGSSVSSHSTHKQAANVCRFLSFVGQALIGSFYWQVATCVLVKLDRSSR